MRFACDTGGTFTDLIVETGDGELRMYKAATTPDDPIKGVLDSLELAAADFGKPLAELLGEGEGDAFIHGTTHAINAIITGNTAKTAFLTTKGHPDILVLREGGRSEPFNGTIPYPEPYVPRALTFEVPERINAEGKVIEALDEAAVIELAGRLEADGVEAVAVCFLWSILNPAHEIRVGELLDRHLPGVPFTLSHALNPGLREYRRASSASIDASLKPLMTSYLGNLVSRLTEAGFSGRVLVLTSQGGMMDATELAAAPIHAINSGPSMAPIAGRHYVTLEDRTDNVIVADTGGTTFDVSLVRRNRIPLTRETWIGQPYRGHLTGFPSVDVKSVGAGGGSIAWVDDGGVLHVGPQSAGAVPGPACYGSGGDKATLTDASVVLGYIDPDYFLGGTMKLDASAAHKVIEEQVATPLALSVRDAAAAVVEVTTENMVQAIADITVNQGIDPVDAVLLGGGGAAGLNSTFIARRLGCKKVVIPEIGAALSAAGALMSDLTAEYRATLFTTSGKFDRPAVNQTLQRLAEKCQSFIEGAGKGSVKQTVEFGVEARYAHQVWEIEVPLQKGSFDSDADVDALVQDFHAAHEELFAFRDSESLVEMIGWSATVRCRLATFESRNLRHLNGGHDLPPSRRVYFAEHGEVEAALHRFEALPQGQAHSGPAIIESPFTTVVIDPGVSFERSGNGSLVIRL